MRIPATDRPWRELADGVRADIAARAARFQPAATAADALTAVSRGRAHVRRASRAMKLTLGAVLTLLAGALLEIGAVLPAVPGFTRNAAMGFFLVPMMIVMVAGGAYAMFGMLRGYVLVRPNLALAATAPAAPVDRPLRIGARYPLLGFAGLAILMIGAAALAIVGPGYRFLGVVPITVTVGAIWFGPGSAGIAHATIDETGIILPIMRVRIPWSAIGAAEITAPNRVTVTTDRYKITGWLPARWRRLAEPNIRPALRLTTAYPEQVVRAVAGGGPGAGSRGGASTNR
jgi:hypothetical protein